MWLVLLDLLVALTLWGPQELWGGSQAREGDGACRQHKEGEGLANRQPATCSPLPYVFTYLLTYLLTYKLMYLLT